MTNEELKQWALQQHQMGAFGDVSTGLLDEDGNIKKRGMGGYGAGGVFGNSGISIGESESGEDFVRRLYAETHSPAFGTQGRDIKDLSNAGFFNTLAPVTIDGKRYARTGEDPNTWRGTDYGKRQHTKALLDQLPNAPIGMANDQYGWLVPEELYTHFNNAAMGDEETNWTDYFAPIFIGLSGAGVGALGAGAAAGAAAGSAGAAGAGAGAAGAAGAGAAGAGAAAGAAGGWTGMAASLAAKAPMLAASLSRGGNPLMALLSAGYGAAGGYSGIANMFADSGGTVSDALSSGAGSMGGGMSSFWDDIYSSYGADASTFDFGGGDDFGGMFQNFTDPNQFDYNWMNNPTLNPEYVGAIPNAVNGLTEGAGIWGTAASTLSGALPKLVSTIGEQAAKSVLSRVLSGSGTSDDYVKLAGVLGSTGLGMLGANQQSNALSQTADKYMSLGAPFRDKLRESYAPGFDLAKQDSAYQGAMDQSANSVLKGLSAKVGNPFDNPGAVMEANKYVTQNTALPQLNTYRSQLGSFGQLGTNTAGTADLGKASTAGSGLDALGYGIGQVTGNNSNKAFEDMMKKFGLNSGSVF